MTKKTAKSNYTSANPATAQPARSQAPSSMVIGVSLNSKGFESVDPDALNGLPEMPLPPAGSSESITRYHLRGVMNLQMYPKQLEDLGQAAAELLCKAITAELLTVTVQTEEAAYDLVCLPMLEIVGTPPWGMKNHHLWPPARDLLQEIARRAAAKDKPTKARTARKSGKPTASRDE